MKAYAIEKITHHGKPYVAMPVTEYDRMQKLIEDVLDVSAVARALREIEAGTEQTYPAAVVYALSDAKTVGERLEIMRKHRKLSKVKLGEMVSVSGQYIGQIETGAREGSPSLFRKLANALECSTDVLL